MKRCLTLVGGWPGSGKSTLCDAFAQDNEATVHYDKDVVTSVLAESLLEQHGCLVSDRESRIYMNHVRPHEYQQLDQMCSKSLQLGKHVIVSAPFHDEFSGESNLLPQSTQIASNVLRIWIDCHKDTLWLRLTHRNAYRDNYKVKHFSAYYESCVKARELIIPDVVISNHGDCIKDALRSFSSSIIKYHQEQLSRIA